MDERLGGAERHLVNRLTVNKLALQLLQRQATLSAEQQRLLETAIEATNELSVTLLEQWWTALLEQARRRSSERTRRG